MDVRERQSGVFQEAREIFKRCLILGAEREAITAYGKHLHGMLKKGLEVATTPLDRRRATKKGLSKMVGDCPAKPMLRWHISDALTAGALLTAYLLHLTRW